MFKTRGGLGLEDDSLPGPIIRFRIPNSGAKDSEELTIDCCSLRTCRGRVHHSERKGEEGHAFL